jgi:hypothetical protein
METLIKEAFTVAKDVKDSTELYKYLSIHKVDQKYFGLFSMAFQEVHHPGQSAQQFSRKDVVDHYVKPAAEVIGEQIALPLGPMIELQSIQSGKTSSGDAAQTPSMVLEALQTLSFAEYWRLKNSLKNGGQKMLRDSLAKGTFGDQMNFVKLLNSFNLSEEYFEMGPQDDGNSSYHFLENYYSNPVAGSIIKGINVLGTQVLNDLLTSLLVPDRSEQVMGKACDINENSFHAFLLGPKLYLQKHAKRFDLIPVVAERAGSLAEFSMAILRQIPKDIAPDAIEEQLKQAGVSARYFDTVKLFAKVLKGNN